MPDIDPRQVHYNGQEYGTGPNGRRYNSQGNETWESEYNYNVNESLRQNEEARINYENSLNNNNNNYYSEPVSSVGSGPSFSLGGMFSGFLGLLAGWFGLFIIAALLMAGAVAVGFVQYHFKGVMSFFGNVLDVIGRIFSMPFVAWPTLFADMWKSLFNPLEFLFSLGIIIYTLLRFRNDPFFVDIPYGLATIGLIVLEFLHHFSGPLGLIGSIYNGFCLSLPVLIIMAILDKIYNR